MWRTPHGRQSTAGWDWWKMAGRRSAQHLVPRRSPRERRRTPQQPTWWWCQGPSSLCSQSRHPCKVRGVAGVNAPKSSAPVKKFSNEMTELFPACRPAPMITVKELEPPTINHYCSLSVWNFHVLLVSVASLWETCMPSPLGNLRLESE